MGKFKVNLDAVGGSSAIPAWTIERKAGMIICSISEKDMAVGLEMRGEIKLSDKGNPSLVTSTMLGNIQIQVRATALQNK